MAYGLTKSLDLEASSSQYVAASDSATLSVTGDLTLEGWVKIESAPGSGVQYTFGAKYTTTGNQRSYSFWYYNSGGTPQMGMTISSLGSNAVAASINHTLAIGSWIHVAFVYTASTGGIEFFVDGSSVGSASGLYTSIFDGTADFQLGRENTTWYMDGEMSLWRLWAETRTEAEITDNMCSVLGPTTNLGAEWTLDAVYTDNSGNSNTLTPSGSPTFATDVPSTCATAVNTTNFFYMN